MTYTSSNTTPVLENPKTRTLRLIGLSRDTDLIALGRQDGIRGRQPQYPEYDEYYKAWSDSYRDYLLEIKSQPDTDVCF
ncbi:MAG: hypothetical protein QNJ70_26430 [Xenococcaceae cyanobacterium MO_207.B15]|nr:hypothetical protein [Xenococcaceae cyanobacterium MO_207.B15]